MTFGFKPPEDRPLGEEGKVATIATLLASVALVIATLLVMTAAFGVTHSGRVDEPPLQQSTRFGHAGAVRG
jgi:hypothetical protein